MQFAHPNYLYGLWFLLPLALFLSWRIKRRKKMLEHIGDAQTLATIMPYYNPKAVRRSNILWFAAIGLLVFSLARPQWGFQLEELKTRGLDIMVVLDTSKSMLATDIQPKAQISRLQLAKYGLADLSKQLKGDRIGIVAFSGKSFMQCPLTSDYNAFRMNLDAIYAGIIQHGGTDIVDALKTTIAGFEKAEGHDQVIVLISDGEDHQSGPGPVLKELKAKGIKVFCLGVGTLEGELIPIVAEDGSTQFLKDAKGNVVKTSLNERFLEQLAVETGGRYIRSLPGDFGVDRIYEHGIANLQREEQNSRVIKSYNERFAYFLAAAFFILGIESLVSKRKISKQ
jgi:Ca-activated chloride channel family protein